MPTVKPTKPSITLPTAFGTSSSNVKTPFTPQELVDGFSASIPQILDGGNLNFIIDALFQFLTWSNAYADWYANGSANTVPYINSSNQLDYASPVFGGANNTFTGNNTFNGNITSSGTNSFSGSNTFSGSVSLGSSATATTPSDSDNSTKVATTAWVNTFDSVRIIETQLPSSQNNYTWYKKYSNGWVEQGGFSSSSFSGDKTFNFPVTMKDTNYTLTVGAGCSDVSGMHGKDYITARAKGSFTYKTSSLAGNFKVNNFSWQVCGIAE